VAAGAEPPIATAAGVTQLPADGAAVRANGLSRAIAPVREAAVAERRERGRIPGQAIGLPCRPVGSKAEPREIVQDAALVFGTRAAAVVILDTQLHGATERPRKSPGVDRVDEMPEMEPSGRRRREARDGVGGEARRQRAEIDAL